MAYQYWRFAKQKHDLAEKSRLIAKGLIFAESQSAKKEIEKLLVQFADTELSAPVLPFYRSESAENLPKIIPVVGNFPITKSDLSAIPNIEAEGLFQIVKFHGDQEVVTLPGWAVILKADDPVAIIAHTDNLPVSKNQPDEPVLIIVDREGRTWNINSYFLYDAGENLQVKWFPEDPNITLFGQVILILRPKRVLDEELNADGWQIDE
jgi:Rubisco Assembly chaperone C-terminal domain/Rubisco accumulation factor 1 alpha helical domain